MRIMPSASSAILHLVSCLALAAPAIAQEPAKPVTDNTVTAADVATTPVTDLNLRKDEIPPLLIAAQERPYELSQGTRCPQIAAAIGELNALLGPDLDVADEDGNGITAGSVAKSVVGSFIPFRGLIREISGANAQERKMQAAIIAGMSRRAFLKGYGQARGCRYPARAATPAVIAASRAAQTQPAKAQAAKSSTDARNGKGVQYVSQPVVQRID